MTTRVGLPIWFKLYEGGSRRTCHYISRRVGGVWQRRLNFAVSRRTYTVHPLISKLGLL